MIQTTVTFKLLWSKIPEISAAFTIGASALVANAATHILFAARSDIHSVSGQLSDSIHLEVIDPTTISVVAGAGYAGFVEYGTATRSSKMGDQVIIPSSLAPLMLNLLSLLGSVGSFEGITEYQGGGPYDIYPVNAKALHFFYKGQEVFASRILNHPGIYPHPFMTPAAENESAEFIAEMSQLERFGRSI